MRSIGTALTTLFAAALLSGAAGCSTVEIRSGAEQTRIERHFGLMSVRLAHGPEPVVARVRSAGIADMPFGVAAGWSRQDIALPGDCRIVLFVERAEQLAALDELLEGVRDVCAVTLD